MSGKSALILGATGQVGRNLLQELLQDSAFTRVGEYGRKVTPAESITIGKDKLQQKTVNFDKIEDAGLKEGKWDVVYITLGTTRALAGSAAAFEKIDREYVVNAARAAKSDDPSHPQRLVYLSSAGAHPSSRFLYPRSKGLTELDLAGLGYNETIVFRPAILTGTNRTDFRLLERTAVYLIGLRSSWTQTQSCPIGTVARAISIAGRIGLANISESAKAHSTSEGGSTPFTVFDNFGTRAIGEEA